MNYPGAEDDKYYLVYEIENHSFDELDNTSWDITKLPGYKRGRGSSLPFSVSLSELTRSKT